MLHVVTTGAYYPLVVTTLKILTTGVSQLTAGPLCTVLHPDHEENEEAIREADAKQSVDEKACDVFLLMWRKDHVNFGVRPVHIEEHHVDKTLLVEPPVGLVKVLLNVNLIFLSDPGPIIVYPCQ